jgi:hypothetical protein
MQWYEDVYSKSMCYGHSVWKYLCNCMQQNPEVSISSRNTPASVSAGWAPQHRSLRSEIIAFAMIFSGRDDRVGGI